MSDKKIVFLTGFMGVGKSATGVELSKILNYSFLDTDTLIEEMYNTTIPKIFEEEGEIAFREYEKSTLEKIKNMSKVIISVGGGMVTYKDNIDIMKKIGVVICLTASPDEIYKRVSSSNIERPLLKCDNPKEKIISLLQKRAYYYIKSDIIINTDNKSVKNVAIEIKERLNL